MCINGHISFGPQKYDTRSYILIKLVYLHNTYDTVKL